MNRADEGSGALRRQLPGLAAFEFVIAFESSQFYIYLISYESIDVRTASTSSVAFSSSKGNTLLLGRALVHCSPQEPPSTNIS